MSKSSSLVLLSTDDEVSYAWMMMHACRISTLLFNFKSIERKIISFNRKQNLCHVFDSFF